ncbi:MAG: hypothetical protein AB1489_15055, partial [Acidobacteriota bacterium]
MAANIQAKSEGVVISSANPLIRLYRSSLGKKYVVAITGFLLFGFVIAHMLGNLQIFLGYEKINAYALMLKSSP